MGFVTATRAEGCAEEQLSFASDAARLMDEAPRLPPKTRSDAAPAPGGGPIDANSRRTGFPVTIPRPPSLARAASEGTHTASTRGARWRLTAPGK